MGENIDDNNPFLSLFPTVEEARHFRDEIYRNRNVLFGQDSPSDKGKGKKPNAKRGSSSPSSKKDKIDVETSAIIENVFLITVNKDDDKSAAQCPHLCIFLKDLSEMIQGRPYLLVSDLEEAVYERLMLEDPSEFLIVRRPQKKGDTSGELEAVESLSLRYLYMSYYRSILELSKVQNEDVIEKCQQTIITYTRMVLCHPDVYEGQDTSQQFIDIFLDFYGNSAHHDHFLQFLECVFKSIEVANQTNEEDIQLSQTVYPILDLIHEKYKTCSLLDCNLRLYFPIIYFFARSSTLAKVLLDHSTPRTVTLGRAFGSTLLGTFLNVSCLPATELGPFEYFDRPSGISQQDHLIMEQNLWLPLCNISVDRYELFNRLMRVSSDIRHQCLMWVGNCCHANAGRARLWTQHVPSMLSTDVSDSYMLNLGNIMLRLCKPFAVSRSPKLLKINPTYCADVISNDEDLKQRGIYLRDLHAETCLITPVEGLRRATAMGYNFSTICFFITHRILNLGFTPVVEKFMRLNQELARVQRLYEEAVVQASENSETVLGIKDRMERGMSQFLSYKAVLLEPESLELMLNFHGATATWLIHIASCVDYEQFETVQFPLPVDNLHYLACIPEFIIDGVAEFVIFLRRFSAKTLELAGKELRHFMTLILVFMGSAERVRNPHLRAKLAEMLEALIPREENYTSFTNMHRERVFVDHPFIDQLVPTLLNVFVSIEMTGQSVAFEQKFNYRRPMYIVMEYIWKASLHREKFKALAVEAEENMEAISPPIFLRFINLLINDAIFLLDEALTYMTRLHEQQQLRQNSNIRNMPPDQRQQNETNYQHMGMLARFHNVMGNSTIHILELLTQEIKSIFTHLTIVDRIAAMLNYFLLHLVGPRRRQLKVKDFAEYEFKPQELVRDISLIYLHLGDSLEFCQAVCRDGRSYSPALFVHAQQVLTKIGQPVLVYQLQELAQRVAEFGAKQKQEDDAMSEAPEEFIDPIMGTVMKDPVTLPSSKVIVDRATIARHLLSDQTDPFNRSPLSMDMVQSNHELKQRILDWLVRVNESLSPKVDFQQPSTSNFS